MTLLTVTVICQCGTGAISVLNVFFVTRDLHASSRLFGIAETAMGVGFIIGVLAAGRMVRWIGARALTWSGLLATGVLAAGYALQRSFPAGLVMLAIYAMPIAMLNTAVAPLLLDAVPREYLGRVMAVFTPVNQLASMLSMVISGWLTSTVLRSFRASFAGVTLNSVSLIFTVAGGADLRFRHPRVHGAAGDRRPMTAIMRLRRPGARPVIRFVRPQDHHAAGGMLLCLSAPVTT